MKDSKATTRRKLLLAGLGGVTGELVLTDSGAQDAAKVMPSAYRVVLENDRVRVLDFVGRPGMGICGEGMHSHPAHLTIVLEGWEGVSSTPGVQPQRVQRKVGDVFWSEAQTHKLENTGKANSRVLIVELKGPAKG